MHQFTTLPSPPRAPRQPPAGSTGPRHPQSPRPQQCRHAMPCNVSRPFAPALVPRLGPHRRKDQDRREQCSHSRRFALASGMRDESPPLDLTRRPA
jgi:hypothetical protein